MLFIKLRALLLVFGNLVYQRLVTQLNLEVFDDALVFVLQVGRLTPMEVVKLLAHFRISPFMLLALHQLLHAGDFDHASEVSHTAFAIATSQKRL